MPTILSRLRGLLAPTTGDQPLRLADGSGGGGGGSALTTKGDVLGFDTAPNRIPVGTNGQVLTADSTQTLGLKWAAGGGGSLTTKGDVLGYDTAPDRVPIGSDGQVLTADSTQALGLKWAAGGGASSAITLAGGSTALDASVASLYLINLTANSSVSLAGAVSGDDVSMLLFVTQGGGSGKLITWPAIAWPGGSAPTLTTTPGNSDVIRVVSGDGTNWFGWLEAANLPSLIPPSGYDATVLADTPVAYWKMQETTGTAALDATVNALNGTYTGTLSLAQSAIAAGLGDSVDFPSGGTSYITVPDNALFHFSAGDYTAEFWMLPASAPAVFQEPLTRGLGLRFVWSGPGTPMQIYINGTGIMTGATSLAVSTAYHIILVASAGTLTLYVNGAVDGTYSGTVNPSDTGNPVLIANLSTIPVHQYVGNLSNVALYASALSSGRVTAHYLAGI